MAFRGVSVLEIKEVLRLWRAGEAKKRIASRLSTDVKLDSVVAAVVEKLEASNGRPRGMGWERCATQRDFIAQKLKGGVRLTKIRRLLARRGVLVSYMTLYRFAVEELGFGQSAPTIRVTQSDIAARLRQPLGTVKTRIRAALLRLRAALA